MTRQEKPLSRQELREQLDAVLHLNGCQQRTAGYNEAKDGKDLDMEDMEQLEQKTLGEALHLIDEYVAGVIPEKHTCNDSCLRNSFEWLAEHKKSVRDWNGFIDNICRRAGIGGES